MKSGSRLQRMEPYLYLLPAVAIIGIFLFYTLLHSFQLTFTDWNGIAKANFVGLKNYVKLFTSDDFWLSIKLTFIWVTMSVVILPITGLILAIVVEYMSRTKLIAGLTRTVLFMPMMMSMVAVGLLWTLIYNPMLGLLNNAMMLVGLIDIGNPVNYLGNSDTAIYMAFIPAIWQWSGFGMVMTCAAMMNIPKDILEAASTDGAHGFKQFWHIVLPLLLPTLSIGATINMIGGFKAFDLVNVMTAGGPGNATRVTSIYIFKQAFVENRMGYASSAAVVLFILVLLFTFLFNKINGYFSSKAGY